VVEPILRVAAILMLIVTIAGAGQLIYWLGSVWLPSADIVPLSVQPFDVSHGEKAGKEEGKHLATLFVREIRRIQNIMAADLSDLRDFDQVRFESLVPKSLNFEPDVSVKVDIQVKAFDMDVVGILESLYKFFDRSDRLQTTMWINERIKLFAALKTEKNLHSIGPWWLERQVDEQAAVETFARLFALDLYKTEVRGLDGLDAISFATFVSGLDKYHEYVRARHSDIRASTAVLDSAGELFQKLVNEGKASGIVYSYLGSVRSIQNQGDAAIAAYTRALELNPSDKFAELARNKVQTAKALQPVPAAAAPPDLALEKLKEQRLPGYDGASLPPSLRNITIAVIATGISPELVKVLGPRLLDSINLYPDSSIVRKIACHGAILGFVMGHDLRRLFVSR
jgi:tetratricopeptide (TPR) repeat protein